MYPFGREPFLTNKREFQLSNQTTVSEQLATTSADYKQLNIQQQPQQLHITKVYCTVYKSVLHITKV